jgi:hypothetical protein
VPAGVRTHFVENSSPTPHPALYCRGVGTAASCGRGNRESGECRNCPAAVCRNESRK